MDDSKTKQLSDPREVAATVLARTASPKRAAKRAGIDLETLREWQKDPLFQQMVVEVRTVNVMRTVITIQRAAPIAAKAIAEELQIERPQKMRRGRPPKTGNPVTQPSRASQEIDPRRVRAAKVILELFTKFTEIGDLVHRIRDLEEQVSRRPVSTPRGYVEQPPALGE